MILKAVLVDDEQDAIDSLSKVIEEFCPEITIISTFTAPTQALKFINENKPDLLFLDIEMPGIDGFELVDLISDKGVEVIFVTACNQYAIRAFKANAIDYIMKPVSIKETIASVKKVIEKRTAGKIGSSSYKNLTELLSHFYLKKIKIPTFEAILYINVKDIVRIEADGRYSKVFLVGNKRILASKTLKELEALLESEIFFRTHKSHIINLSFVKQIDTKVFGTIKLEDGSTVEISRRKKDEFLKIMGNQYFSN